MKTTKKLTIVSSLFAASALPSSGIVIVISDLVNNAAVPVQNIENYLNGNFSNVTEIRHANYADFNAAATQDALNGTGAHAGNGAADVVIIGRSLSSGNYQGGVADGYNSLAIPVVSLTSYTVRTNNNRMGWHSGSTTTNKLVAGDETTVTAAGASILGLAAGTHDLLFASDPVADTFNGLGVGTVGDGDILATTGGDLLAVYWEAGDAPGNPTEAGVATFGGPRLLFNTDNDPTTGNNGANDLANMTPAGLQALTNALDFATPLTANVIPEPSTSLLGVFALGFLARRRR